MMDAARWSRIQQLFSAAVDLPANERRTFLEAECGGDQALLAEVLAMIEEGSRGDSLLDRDVSHVAHQVLGEAVPLPYRQAGPYRIVRMLGEGGMGVVYFGQRDDVGQVAAIKILRDAWLSPARRERFLTEQRTLAQLNHPSIARLYDSSEFADGTPWFAMEYVEGDPLTKYCQQRDSSIEERLRLFREVCQAVQHAHLHAVIHRDLKPSNVLVRADGSVRLLDFGIAKQLDRFDAPNDYTRTGLRLMTPAYAAPEQIRGGNIGVYTDVYSLGVMLYELLAGRQVASPLNELGNIAMARQQYDEAERRFTRMVGIYRAVYNNHHYLVGIALSNLAGVSAARKQYSQAEELYRQAIQMFASTLPAGHLNIGIAQIKLGRALLRQQRFRDAENQLLAGHAILVKQASPSLVYLQNARRDLVSVYEALKQPEDARKFQAELGSSAQSGAR